MLNLQAPFQARRWLRLLREDEQCGFRLFPNLDVHADRLGFSLRSNKIGLRGPCDENASHVVLGTSYAMGMAVNNGENWYELCLPRSGWLNLGLAVGIDQWRILESLHHRGPKECVVLIYHPNIWIHCLLYERWKESGLSLFEALRWKTDWASCTWLSLKRAVRRRAALRSGALQSVESAGRSFEVNADYARLPETMVGALFERNIEILITLLGAYKRIVVVRIPVKEELATPGQGDSRWNSLICQFNGLWEETIKALDRLNGVEVPTPARFSLRHYHSRDSHWNADGNRVFAAWWKETL